MAKFEKNKNEAPEVDLKNLTVKLAGMGMDKEVEEMASTRKTRNYTTVDDEETSDSEESLEEKIADNADEIIEAIDGAEDEVSEEVEEFYEKRAQERNLTLEKVEELASEMESSTEEKAQKIVKLSKSKVEASQPTVEKKRVRIDAVTLVGILIALVVLGGGVFYLVHSLSGSSDLGMTQAEYSNRYHDTEAFKSVLAPYGFTMVEPTYRTSVEEDAKAKVFDLTVNNSLNTPVSVVGFENKSSQNLIRIRFSITFDKAEALGNAEVFMIAFMQAFYPDRDMTVCYGSITGALEVTQASTKDAVAIKDGDYAYALTLRTLEDKYTLVMDVIPVASADNYNFTDSL